MKKLLLFSAEWCSACKRLKPVVEKEATDYDVEILDVDEDDGAFFADKYNVRGLPTIIVLENGKEVKRAVGSTAWEEVQE
jgi:thioredoxin 1